jgi:hypothetical protein
MDEIRYMNGPYDMDENEFQEWMWSQQQSQQDYNEKYSMDMKLTKGWNFIWNAKVCHFFEAKGVITGHGT